MIFLYVIAIIGAILGGITFVFGTVFASGAPQQAAVAAMAVALAVIPYVLARSVQIITQDGAKKRHDKQLLAKLDALIAAQQPKPVETNTTES